MNRAYELAKADLGTWEWAEGHNPKVVQYFADVGHGWVMDDETAWCAAFVGAMLKRAGMPHTGKLTARSYEAWGVPVGLDEAQEGDIVVFSRGDPSGWQGHVGFYVGRAGNGDIQVLGGNQGNQVNIRTYPASRLLAVRRSPQMREPTPVRVQSVQRPTPTKQAKQNAGGLTAGAGAVAGAVGSVAAASSDSPEPVQWALAAVIVMGVGFLIWRAWRAE